MIGSPESLLIFSSRLKNITSFEIAKKQNTRSHVYSHSSDIALVIERLIRVESNQISSKFN